MKSISMTVMIACSLAFLTLASAHGDALDEYHACINDCSKARNFCVSLVQQGLPACKRSCDSECWNMDHVLDPFCKVTCYATCSSNHDQGLAQCHSEYASCLSGCYKPAR